MEELSPRKEGGPAPDGRNGAQAAGYGGDRDMAPGLDRHAADHIGQRLRDYYSALAAEPLPSKIASLLARLDNADRRSE